MSRTSPVAKFRNISAKTLTLNDVLVTATAAEINAIAGGGLSATELGFLDGVTAGTNTASKALVAGTNHQLDVLALPVSGLKIGAGAGTAVTTTAAELNVLASVTAGTAAASKAAVLGATSNLDTLALPVSGLKIGAGAGTAVTASAAELNQLTGATATAAQLTSLAAGVGAVAFDRSIKIARVALAALDTGGGVLSWANPEAGSIIITRVVLDITTKATSACTVDVGTTASTSTTSSDNLIDGLDTNAAAGVFDNITEKGSNGKSRQKLATGKWVTASMASGAAAGTVGFAYIEYFLI